MKRKDARENAFKVLFEISFRTARTLMKTMTLAAKIWDMKFDDYCRGLKRRCRKKKNRFRSERVQHKMEKRTDCPALLFALREIAVSKSWAGEVPPAVAVNEAIRTCQKIRYGYKREIHKRRSRRLCSLQRCRLTKRWLSTQAITPPPPQRSPFRERPSTQKIFCRRKRQTRTAAVRCRVCAYQAIMMFSKPRSSGIEAVGTPRARAALRGGICRVFLSAKTSGHIVAKTLGVPCMNFRISRVVSLRGIFLRQKNC